MENNSKNFPWWLFVVLPLVLSLVLLLLAIAFFWRGIEADVLQRAQTQIAQSDFTWAELKTQDHGRDLQLSGNAPSTDAVTAAKSLLSQVEGVRVVDWVGQVDPEQPSDAAELTPASFTLGKIAEQITLSGVAGAGTTVDLALADVENKLQLQQGVANVDNLSGLIELLQDLPNGASLAVDGGVLQISGTVDALGKKKAASAQAKALFTGEIDNQLLVELATISAEQLVDNQACQQQLNALTATSKVNFQTGKALVLPDSFALLDQFTQQVRRCPEASISVIGHTDNTGDAQANQALSLARAQAVLKHIVDSGVPSERFSAIGKGSSEPIADNLTNEGRARNRRVEFSLAN